MRFRTELRLELAAGGSFIRGFRSGKTAVRPREPIHLLLVFLMRRLKEPQLRLKDRLIPLGDESLLLEPPFRSSRADMM